MPLITFPLDLSKDKLDELACYLTEKLQFSMNARASQLDDKYRRWQQNYAGEPMVKERTTPFVGASNFVPQLIRMHTDIYSARMCGIFFATKPFWRIKSLLKEVVPHEALDQMSNWMEYLSFSKVNIFEPIDRAIFQTAKTGTSLTKVCWTTKKYSTMLVERSTEQPLIEELDIDECKLLGVSFDDFWPWPITAPDLSEVLIKFHRIRLAKEEVEQRRKLGLWNADAVERLLQGSQTPQVDAKREQEATESGIQLTADVGRPFNVIEAWLDYPLENTGRLTPCIITFNPLVKGSEGILRAIHNYYPPSVEPFADFRMMPRDDLFYGYAIPEILEQAQEEQAQIHNARRDANMIANVPTFKKRMYGNVPNPVNSWYPGKVFELENMDDLDLFTFQGNYNSMLEEEAYLMQLAERYTGIQPPMQGMGAGSMDGKRGIYQSQGTLALLSEGNKRLDIFLRRVRAPFASIGRCIAYSYKQFREEWPEITLMGESGRYLEEILNAKDPKGLTNLVYDISASDAGTNRELDRQNLLLMANTMAAYYRQVVEAGTFLAQLPEGHPVAPLLLSTLEGARDLANRLLFVFEVGDRDRLLPDLSQIFPTGGREGVAQPPGMPGTAEPIGQQQLQDIVSYLTALSGRGAEGAGGSGLPQ